MEMEFDVKFQGAENVDENCLVINLNIPPGDLPYYITCKSNVSKDEMLISFKYNSNEKNQDISKDLKGIRVVYGEDTGRVYEIFIPNFSEWNKGKQICYIINKKIKDIQDQISSNTHRVRNNISNGAELAKQSLTRYLEKA